MSRTQNITYLIGAGASFGKRDPNKHHTKQFERGLPIMNEIKEALNDLTRHTNSENWQTDYTVNERNANAGAEILQAAEELTLDIRWLIASAYENHETIDAFAKKLAHDRDYEKLFKLKAILSVLFLFIQGNNKPDIRYDKLISDLLVDDFVKPTHLDPHVKILSWNYDFQFELSLRSYFSNFNLGGLHSDIIQSFPCCGSHKDHCEFDVKKFSLTKLNGSAGLFVNSKDRITELTAFPFEKSIFAYIKLYKKIITEQKAIDILFQYAWQSNVTRENLKSRIIQIAKQTDILIMIGYSFFSTNRDIDDLIFNNLDAHKIYVQDFQARDIIFKLKNNYTHLSMNDDPERFYPIENVTSFLSYKDV